MKNVRNLLVAVAVVSLALPAFAKLSKYRGWENSPEGYFMTRAERDQWSKIDTDADAEKFIADFHARRPDNFEKEVADRAANADKYLTVGKTQGSKSLRGKVVILLGPPNSMDMSERAVANSEKHDNPVVASAMSNMNAADTGGGGGMGNSRAGSAGGVGGGANSLGGSMSTSQPIRIIHFNYQGDVARTADRKAIDINVEVDQNTGKDRIASRREESDLNSVFELVAQSWVKK